MQRRAARFCRGAITPQCGREWSRPKPLETTSGTPGTATSTGEEGYVWKSRELGIVLSWNQTFSGSDQRGRQCRIITVGVPFSAFVYFPPLSRPPVLGVVVSRRRCRTNFISQGTQQQGPRSLTRGKLTLSPLQLVLHAFRRHQRLAIFQGSR